MFYNFANLAVGLLLRLLTRCWVEGVENIPSSGPLLVVANHINLVDPPVLGALLPRRIVFMGKEELFGVPIIGWVVKWYGAFAIKRGSADRQALRTAAGVLEKGNALGMFPEGTRSKSGRMAVAHPGAALLAMLASAPVLPVAITGTDRLRSWHWFLTRPTITVRIGQPFRLERDRSGKGSLEESTRAMMARVALLLPEDQRGYYSEAASQLEKDTSLVKSQR